MFLQSRTPHLRIRCRSGHHRIRTRSGRSLPRFRRTSHPTALRSRNRPSCTRNFRNSLRWSTQQRVVPRNMLLLQGTVHSLPGNSRMFLHLHRCRLRTNRFPHPSTGIRGCSSRRQDSHNLHPMQLCSTSGLERRCSLGKTDLPHTLGNSTWNSSLYWVRRSHNLGDRTCTFHRQCTVHPRTRSRLNRGTLHCSRLLQPKHNHCPRTYRNRRGRWSIHTIHTMAYCIQELHSLHSTQTEMD